MTITEKVSIGKERRSKSIAQFESCIIGNKMMSPRQKVTVEIAPKRISAEGNSTLPDWDVKTLKTLASLNAADMSNTSVNTTISRNPSFSHIPSLLAKDKALSIRTPPMHARNAPRKMELARSDVRFSTAPDLRLYR